MGWWNDNQVKYEHSIEKVRKSHFRLVENNDIDTVNGRRTEILRNCIEEGKRNRGIFRLTVPTGGGKQ